MFVQNKMHIAVPYCSAHWKARVRTGWAIGGFISGGMVSAILLMSVGVSALWSVMAMLALICVGLLNLAKLGSSFRPVYMNNECGKFKGASMEFLEILSIEPPA